MDKYDSTRRREPSPLRPPPTNADRAIAAGSPHGLTAFKENDMNELYRLMRRMQLRWQLRSLERQAQSIVVARNHALARLWEIQRDTEAKQLELLHCGMGNVQAVGAR